MESLDNLPATFAQVKQSLDPFIKTRLEISKIRRLLTAHLEAQISYTAESRTPLLALTNASVHVKSANSLTGLRKEYLESLRSNIEARRNYNNASRGSYSPRNNQTSPGVVSTGPSLNISVNISNADDHLERYIALVRLRQRHERLRILQNYITSLPHGSGTPIPSLEDAANLASLPRIPADVITNPNASSQESTQVNLGNHIRDLEKAVFQAKTQLRSEKEALEKARAIRPNKHANASSIPGTSTERVEKLRALSRTRDELISWIEEELGKAGDSAPQSGDEKQLPSTPGHESMANEQLTLIKSQYAHYIASRKNFLDTVCHLVDLQVPGECDSMESEGEVQGNENLESATCIIPPYLENFLLMSNEQKCLIQQRAHINVSLAKQHKETVRLFDRLAEESQLLSTFPNPSPKNSIKEQGLSNASPDDEANKVMASSYYRARLWTVAANSASMATSETVRNNVEEGKFAVEGAQQELSNLLETFGKDVLDCKYGEIDSEDVWVADMPSKRPATKSNCRSKPSSASGSIWDLLDGNLGVLKRDQHK